MATIAHFHSAFKNDVFNRNPFTQGLLSQSDILTLAQEQGYQWRNRVWDPVRTFWAFLIQILYPDASCRETVSRVLAEQAAEQQPLRASPDPSAYCQARKRLPLALFQNALYQVGNTLQKTVEKTYLWLGRRVWIVDGTSCSMPDTPQLKSTFSYPYGQKAGCGFPVAKMVALFGWASGAVLDMAIGPWQESELNLCYGLFKHLKRNDILMGDRFYGTYRIFSELVNRHCDGVFRLHNSREQWTDFRRGKRLGVNERLITWYRPSRMKGLTKDQVQAYPDCLTLRVIRYYTNRPGFRSQCVYLSTTLLDAVIYPLESLAGLYGDRWSVELRLHDVKTTLRMDICRGKSTDIVLKEIYMHLLAYNLIRALMYQASETHHRFLHQISFAGTIQRVDVFLPYLWLFRRSPKGKQLSLILLAFIAHDKIPCRPKRREPRVLKRRPKGYGLLTKPRQEFKEIPRRGRR